MPGLDLVGETMIWILDYWNYDDIRVTVSEIKTLLIIVKRMIKQLPVNSVIFMRKKPVRYTDVNEYNLRFN